MPFSHLLSSVCVAALTSCGVSGAADGLERSPEARAVAFLAGEVPRWSAENDCFSCHNNGDAARALYTARRLSLEVPDSALADTTQWLLQPEGWDDNGGDERFSDKALARVQFAAALRTAIETGTVVDRKALVAAAESLLEYQSNNGSWQIGAAGTVGSPATYGPFLATYQVRRTLEEADAERFAGAIAKADRWFRETPAKTVLDAAATLLALGEADDAQAKEQVRRSLEVIRRGEAKPGGWGPYVNSTPEPFDTAVVVLALLRLRHSADMDGMLRRGRAYLVASQLADGSWIETTRPEGAVSYAQRISTTGWATLALLATREMSSSAPGPPRQDTR